LQPPRTYYDANKRIKNLQKSHLNLKILEKMVRS